MYWKYMFIPSYSFSISKPSNSYSPLSAVVTSFRAYNAIRRWDIFDGLYGIVGATEFGLETIVRKCSRDGNFPRESLHNQIAACSEECSESKEPSQGKGQGYVIVNII
jgi:hypothetical protein